MTAPDKTVSSPLYAYLHTHWDREWYGTFRTYQIRLAQVLDEILDRLDRAELPCFTLDGQTVLLEDYLELRPQNRDRLKRLVQSGKLHLGPWFVMPDEFLVSGESLLRNLQRGIQEARAWGSQSFTGYLPDTFGHSGDIPTLLKMVGINSAIVWRGVPVAHGSFEQATEPLFHWQSPSKESVQTLWLEKGYFQNVLTDLEHTPESRHNALKTLLQALYRPTLPTLLPIGGDHLGSISQGQLEWLKQHEDVSGRLEIIHPHQYFEQSAIQQKALHLSTLTGELTDCETAFLLPGVYSSRLYLKQANRILEHRLTRKIEPWLAYREAMGQELSSLTCQHELDLAWKQLLLNHPHDSICGCSIDAVHRENEVRFQEVADIVDALEHRLWASGFQSLTTPQWKLLNLGQESFSGVIPLIWLDEAAGDEAAITEEESTWVSQGLQIQEKRTILANQYLADVQDVPMAHLTQTQYTGWGWVQDLPAFSEQWLSKETDGETAHHQVLLQNWSLPEGIHPAEAMIQTPEQTDNPQAVTLSNGLLDVTFQIGQAGCEVRQAGSAQDDPRHYPRLFELWDFEDQGDSYNSGPIRGSVPKQAIISTLTLLDAGPLVTTLEVVYQLQGVSLSATFQLQAGEAAITVALTLENYRPNHKLQWLCETGTPIHAVQAESHFSVVSRQYDPNYHESKVPPPEPFKELKTNTGPIQRFIQANTQAFITEGLCEYEVKGSQLGLTVLRAFGALSSAQTGVRGAQAGPPFETPEGQCLNRVMTLRCQWRPSTQRIEKLYQWADQFYGVAFGKRILPKKRHLKEELLKKDLAGLLISSQTKATQPECPSPLVHWDEKRLRMTAMTWLQKENSESKAGLILRLVNVSAEKVLVHFQGTLQYHHLEALNGLHESFNRSNEDTVTPFDVPYEPFFELFFEPFEVKTILFCVE